MSQLLYFIVIKLLYLYINNKYTIVLFKVITIIHTKKELYMKKVLVVFVALLCLVGMTNAQGKLSLSVQGALSLPMGDFGDACKTGFGGLGTLTYKLNNNIDIVATSGYLTYTTKISSDLRVSEIPVLGGIRYYMTVKGFRPYLTALAGIFSSKADAKIGTVSVSATSTDFGFTGGAGFLYALSSKLDLDVTATYNSISSSGSSTSFINVLAGVHFAF